jgi:hypothetical protein
MRIDLRVAMLGINQDRSRQGILVAIGLAVLVLVVSVFSLVADPAVEAGLVLVGFGLASWWAYDNSGLVVSVSLVLAPVVARLTYFWRQYVEQPAPVSLPLSFEGHGAWEMWVPLALLLGVVAFVFGVSIRRSHRFITLYTKSGV